MRAVFLNPVQSSMLDRLRAAEARFGDIPSLRASADAIDSARTLIDEAAALKMPSASYVGLQTYVSSFDGEMQLPELARSLATDRGLSGEDHEGHAHHAES